MAAKLTKQANGEAFEVEDGGDPIVVNLSCGTELIVYRVCLWGQKPDEGQRPRVFCTPKQDTVRHGGDVELPNPPVLKEKQVTWSGGVVATHAGATGPLVVTISQGERTAEYTYPLNLADVGDNVDFYDGVNLA